MESANYQYISQTNGMNYKYPLGSTDLDQYPSSIVTLSGNDGLHVRLAASALGSATASYIQSVDQPYYVPDQESCFDNWSTPTQSGSSEVTDDTPVITSIDPAAWAPGSTQQVTFSGYNFGNNGPTLNWSPNDDGLSVTINSSSDTQIVATVSVASWEPNEDIQFTVTSHGSNGSAFSPGTSGKSATSSGAYASVQSGPSSPVVTAVGWIDGNAISLPSNQSAELDYNLNSSAVSCAETLTSWLAGNILIRSDPDDVAYANAWLNKHSGNAEPPATINVSTLKQGGDFRALNSYSPGGGTYALGATPDPCGAIYIPAFLRAPEAHPENGRSNVSPSQKKYQLAEGRVGTVGQVISGTINGRSVPFIWSVITFDANQNYDYGDHAQFPTYSIYVNGTRVAVHPQSSVSSFVALDESYQRTTGQIQ